MYRQDAIIQSSKVLHIPGKSNLLFPGQKLNKQKSSPLSGNAANVPGELSGATCDLLCLPPLFTIRLNVDVCMEMSLHPSHPDSHRVNAVQSGRKSSFPDLLVDEIHCNDLDEVQENGSLPEMPSPLKIGMLHHRHPGPDLFTQVCDLGALSGTLPAEKRGCHSGSAY